MVSTVLIRKIQNMLQDIRKDGIAGELLMKTIKKSGGYIDIDTHMASYINMCNNYVNHRHTHITHPI